MIIQPGPVVDFLISNQDVRDPFSLDWSKAKRVLKNLSLYTWFNGFSVTRVMMVLFYVLLFGYFPFDELDLTMQYSEAHAIIITTIFHDYHSMLCYKSQHFFVM